MKISRLLNRLSTCKWSTPKGKHITDLKKIIKAQQWLKNVGVLVAN
jgi:hypothetical protein